MTSLNDDVTLKFRSARESAREWKKREDKRGYCAYENKKKDKLHLYNDYRYDYDYYCD